MRFLRILLVVIGSVFFFPVSCTVALFAGIHLVAKIDERSVDDGDQVHSLFKVVYETESVDQSFGVVRLRNLADRQNQFASGEPKGTMSFLMSEPRGKVDVGGSSISYEVLESFAGKQVIEVVDAYHDGDNTIWSRYEAGNSSISPISSRMFYFGYMFTAFLYAFGFALILHLVGDRLGRKYRKRSLESAGN